MNVTIPDLAPLEDTLVEEITEHERGACELVNHDCSVTPVSIVSWHHEPMLACRAVTDIAIALISDKHNAIPCAACDVAPWSACWSVVMLP